MANITQINVNGTTYDIKDAGAGNVGHDDSASAGSAVPINADQLNGHPYTYFTIPYQTGETITATDYRLAIYGFSNSTSKTLHAYYSLPKPVSSNVTSITINNFLALVCGSSGQAIGYTDFTASPYTLTAEVMTTGNLIRFTIENTSAFNVTALSPIVLFFSKFSISFA